MGFRAISFQMTDTRHRVCRCR